MQREIPYNITKQREGRMGNEKDKLSTIFQKDKQWVISQYNDVVYSHTLSYTRAEAIKKFMNGMDDRLKWNYFKKKYGVHCKKVTVCYSEGWN